MSVGMEGLPILARSRMSPSPIRPWEAASRTPASMISNSRATFVGGAKGGYFFESRPWLGLETEVYTLKPNVKHRRLWEARPQAAVFATNIRTIPLRLTTWAVNLIIRSPSMSDVFQPYGGIGYGLFFATGSQDGQSNTHISPGFNSSQAPGMC